MLLFQCIMCSPLTPNHTKKGFNRHLLMVDLNQSSQVYLYKRSLTVLESVI